MIEIGKGKNISEKELVFKASRSSGPGGQNINKVNTRITLFFDVKSSDNLSDSDKRRILKRLATRADKNGVIRIASQKYRTQKANRNAAVDKLQKLLADALTKRKTRKKTIVPYSAREKRLEEKKKRGLLKKQRAKRKWGNGGDD